MVMISVHNAIRRPTKAAFGAPIPPHWFRDVAVTFPIRDKPASACIAGAFLGHATPDIIDSKRMTLRVEQGKGQRDR